MKILSFDVGGTKISWALVDENGAVLTSVQSVPTPKTAAEIEDLLRKISADTVYDSCSLATAGVVFENVIQGKPNNLPVGYDKINFTDVFKAPYIIENDATAALWAEFCIGALKDVKHGIMLTLGTAVGCGIICNGEVVRGKCGAAGEYDFKFSGRDLQNLARQYGATETDCFKLLNAARQGDEPSRLAYREWEEQLLNGLSMLNRLLDTEIIALSGSLSKIVDYAKINTALKLLEPRNPPVVKAALCGTNAGFIGAALLCCRH
ncbi:MAG: ROK family protein [Alphaproteobacteria bacterium]|nr:ROK family protein [Alphaproteobacteria bacterium]